METTSFCFVFDCNFVMTRQSEKVKDLERLHPHSGTTEIIIDGRPYAFTTASKHEEQCLLAIFASDCAIHQGKGLTKTATIWVNTTILRTSIYSDDNSNLQLFAMTELGRT
jgi:hypothetical protein